MDPILIVYMDIFVVCYFFLLIRKEKDRIPFSIGMNISIVMGGMLALLTGVLLIIQYPFHFTVITIVTVLIGGVTGTLFGRLFTNQTSAVGAVNGILVGFMAPMIGAVIEIPSLFVLFTQFLFAFLSLWMLMFIKRV